MAHLLRGALVGAVALGGVAVTSADVLAMPVGNLAWAVGSEAGQSSQVQDVYWRYGYGWHRPYGWRYGYGLRRPYGFRVYRPYWGGYQPYWGGRRWRRW